MRKEEIAKKEFNALKEKGHYELSDSKSEDYWIDGYVHALKEADSKAVRFGDYLLYAYNIVQDEQGLFWEICSAKYTTAELFSIFEQENK